MELILNLLYLYISAYSIYFLVSAIKNLNDRKFRIQQKYSNTSGVNNICVIIYSHNNEATLETW